MNRSMIKEISSFSRMKVCPFNVQKQRGELPQCEPPPFLVSGGTSCSFSLVSSAASPRGRRQLGHEPDSTLPIDSAGARALMTLAPLDSLGLVASLVVLDLCVGRPLLSRQVEEHDAHNDLEG